MKKILLGLMFVAMLGADVANAQWFSRGGSNVGRASAIDGSGNLRTDLFLKNKESFSNDTDGIVCINGVGGTNNENICFDLETTANVVTLTTDTGVARLQGSIGHRYLNDTNVQFGSDPDVEIGWETTGNDNLQIGTAVGASSASGYVSIMERADMGHANRSPTASWPNGATPANVTLCTASADAATGADDVNCIWHDQTDGYIGTGAGDLVLLPASGFVGIGVAPTETLTVSNASDASLRVSSSNYNNDATLMLTEGNNDHGLVIGIDGNENSANFYKRVSDSNTEFLKIDYGGSGGVVFNEDGLDIDFRVEGSGAANALFVQGSDGFVGVGTGSPGYLLDVVSSSTSRLKINSSGELQGDPLNDQFAYQTAGIISRKLTAEKLLFAWTTPATTEQDLSGNNHDGTYQGTMTTGDQINKGLVWALDFDDSDDYISVADHADFSFGDGATDSAFSYGGWVEIVDGSGDDFFISKRSDASGATQREWAVFVRGTEKARCTLWDDSAAVEPYIESSSALSTGWHFLVCTYDGTGGASAANGLTMYSNGAAVAVATTNNASYVAMEDKSASVFIGAYTSSGGTPTSYYNGDIGHVFITAEELTANDVRELYLETCGMYNQCTIGF